jgi:hypothetical protein
VYGKQSSKLVRNVGGDEVNTGKTTTTYCTLYRIGYWASLDAKCKTEIDDYGDFTVLTHNVWYVLIGKYGDVTGMVSGCETSLALSAIRRVLVMSQGPDRSAGLSLANAGLAVRRSATT